MRVNGNEAEPGCYIAGHHGQYGIDQLGDICEDFGLTAHDEDAPAYWRKAAEAETSEGAAIVPNAVGIGSHLATPEECWERQIEAADELERRLNEATTGGYWAWEGGEFFLTQTEVEGFLYVEVNRDEGEDYDDAWQELLDYGPEAGITSYLDLAKGQEYHRFKITVEYEPEE